MAAGVQQNRTGKNTQLDSSECLQLRVTLGSGGTAQAKTTADLWAQKPNQLGIVGVAPWGDVRVVESGLAAQLEDGRRQPDVGKSIEPVELCSPDGQLGPKWGRQQIETVHWVILCGVLEPQTGALRSRRMTSDPGWINDSRRLDHTVKLQRLEDVVPRAN